MNPAIFTMLAWEKELEIRRANCRHEDRPENSTPKPSHRRNNFVQRFLAALFPKQPSACSGYCASSNTAHRPVC